MNQRNRRGPSRSCSPRGARSGAASLVAAIVAAVTLLAGSRATAASELVGPYLLDPAADGVVVAWEARPAASGAVIVDTKLGERRFPVAPAEHHAVHIGGLAPGSYAYRVVDEAGATIARGSFSTAARGDTFSFVVFGDTRDVSAAHERTVDLARKQHADFVLHVGDMVREGGDESLWREFFRIEAPLIAATPLYAALGNHELVADANGQRFRRFFGRGDTSATWYEFRYGGSLFLALDGNRAENAEQLQWLKHELDAADADTTLRHLFVFVHQPPLSNGIFCGDVAAQERWLPLFERHHVLAVFAGHEHHYERLEHAGVTYFVTGGGGSWLIPDRRSCPALDTEALQRFVVEHHLLRVRVSGANVAVDALTPDGTVIDSAVLHETREPAPMSHHQRTPDRPRPHSPTPPTKAS